MRGVFFGLVAAAVFAQLIVAVVLGYWWSSLAGLSQDVGQQFRALRLGRILGVPATLVMAVSLFIDAALVQNLFPLALFGFRFQGLALAEIGPENDRNNSES